MKTFNTVVMLRQPAEPVWATMRDRLPELVPMIDDVESITVVERELLAPHQTRLVNEWRPRQQIPELLRNTLHSSELGWIDRNVWDEDTGVCTWEIEPTVFTDDIRCEGTTTFQPAMGGRGCRVTFAGRFELAPGALSKLVGPLQRRAEAFIESIVTTVIPQNTRKVLEAAAQLASQDSSR